MAQINRPVNIGHITAENRICVPPMVLYGHAGADGRVTAAHVDHYRALARGGPGLIIQEATCVLPGGRLRMDQLGIWEDGQLSGLAQIAAAVHEAGRPIFVQLHHGAVRDLAALETADLEAIRDAFVEAAVRARTAGYDGAELHGCHGYLICQMLSRRTNRRTDRYGDGLTMLRELFAEIRARTGTDFVLGVRLGGFAPALSDGIAQARAIAAMGADFLDVSYGTAGEMEIHVPAGFPFSGAVYAAGEIKRAVDIPVFAVDGIRTPEDAEAVLAATGADMADVGRSALVDPDWTKKALAGQTPGRCLGCRVCQWRVDSEKCPGRKRIKG